MRRVQTTRTFLALVIMTVFANAAMLMKVWADEGRFEPSLSENVYSRLRTGDVVLRAGKGLVSDWFRRSSQREKVYSHAGIIIIDGGRPMVAHMQQDKPGSPVIVEKLDDFWNPEYCIAGAVYRYKSFNNDRMAFLIESIQKDIRNQVQFDGAFSLDGKNRFYCTEWIRRSYKNADPDFNSISQSKAGDFSYIAPDDLYLNGSTELIYRFRE